MDKENEKIKEAEVVKIDENGKEIEVIEPDDIVTFANRRLEKVKQMISVALKITTHLDWINQDGSPYLMHSGAEKVARLFGVKISNVETKKTITEDSKGKFYLYATTGMVSLPGNFDAIEALGTCSQHDRFFGKAHGEWLDSSKIDETNIMKKSYTNFVVNGITHLLGLRNITWDMLKEAEIDVSKIQKVEYGKDKKQAEQKLSAKDKETRDKLWDICVAMSADNPEFARENLKKFTFFKTNEGEDRFCLDIKRLTSARWINTAYGTAKKSWEEYQKSIKMG